MKIRCLKFNDIIESKSIHDCKRCKCGECSTDGGDVYHIIGGNFEITYNNIVEGCNVFIKYLEKTNII